MRVLAFAVFFALTAIAYGFWPFGSPVPTEDAELTVPPPPVDPVVAALGVRPELRYVCHEHLYSSRTGTYASNPIHARVGNKYVLFPVPPRHPRSGLSFEDLQYAHLIITYEQCKCFDPTTQEGWDYLMKCHRLFNDLDNIVNKYIEVKKEMATWDEKAKQLNTDP